MPLIKPKNHTLWDIYPAWCKKKLQEGPEYSAKWDGEMRRKGIQIIYKTDAAGNKKVYMTYKMSRYIIESFNKLAVEALISGKKVGMGPKMGHLHAARIERNFSKPMVNFGATKAIRAKNPKHPPVYYTDDDYCIIYWQKYHRIKDESIYRFIFAHSVHAKKKFVQTLKDKPVLKHTYKYYPYIIEKKHDRKLDNLRTAG